MRRNSSPCSARGIPEKGTVSAQRRSGITVPEPTCPAAGPMRRVAAPMHQPLEGIAAADARLGRPFPLPRVALPLARWVEVTEVGAGAEVAWNLDDSRSGAPGRLALYAGREPPPPRELPDGGPVEERGGVTWRSAPLPDAQPALRPVRELRWTAGDLHLRLTAQGPWHDAALEAIVASIPVGSRE